MKETENEQTVIGSNSAIRVGVVVLMLSVAVWGATLTSDVNTIKSSMFRLNSIDSLTAKIDLLAARLDSLEKRGSDPMQQLQKSMDQLSADLKMHVMTTVKKDEPKPKE